MHAEARLALDALTPAPPDLRDWTPYLEPERTFETARLRVTFDESGAIAALCDRASGNNLLAPDGRLGSFRYQTFSTEDGKRFISQYNGAKAATGAEAGFAAALLPEHAASGMWPARLLSLWTRRGPAHLEVLCAVTFDSRAHIDYGAPAQAFLHYTFPDYSPSIRLTLQWFKKTATRLPEALWLTFQPLAPTPEGWHVEKMGRWISPLEVVSRGGRKLHAVAGEVRYRDDARHISIRSLDAPLLAPGQPALMQFDNQLPDLAGGMHFNLFNNQWTTNFPQWYEDDALFRYEIEMTSYASQSKGGQVSYDEDI